MPALDRAPATLNHEPSAVLYAREKSGLSQADAARQIGIGASYLSEIERGTRNARPVLLQKLAELYNCPLVMLERKRFGGAA